MVERARGKGNLRTKTITMYCVLIIATVVLKYLKRVSILILKSVMNLDNIKVFRRFVYQRNIKRNLDL
jgi:hypothetical protein